LTNLPPKSQRSDFQSREIDETKPYEAELDIRRWKAEQHFGSIAEKEASNVKMLCAKVKNLSLPTVDAVA